MLALWTMSTLRELFYVDMYENRIYKKIAGYTETIHRMYCMELD